MTWCGTFIFRAGIAGSGRMGTVNLPGGHSVNIEKLDVAITAFLRGHGARMADRVENR